MPLHDKSTKETSNYREGNEEKRCGNCTMFRSPHECTAVKGYIEREALCDYFKRRIKERGRLYR